MFVLRLVKLDIPTPLREIRWKRGFEEFQKAYLNPDIDLTSLHLHLHLQPRRKTPTEITSDEWRLSCWRFYKSDVQKKLTDVNGTTQRCSYVHLAAAGGRKRERRERRPSSLWKLKFQYHVLRSLHVRVKHVNITALMSAPPLFSWVLPVEPVDTGTSEEFSCWQVEVVA